MAYQIQMNLRDFGGMDANDLDRIAYEATQFVQSRIPSKIFGYGIVLIDDPERSIPRSATGEPATADVIMETAAPIRMLADALL